MAIEYSQSFLATWGVYPKRNGKKRGKSQAFAEWEKLDIDEQRAAYSDIKARNMSGGWEFVRDMQRYLKHREWEDEWQGQRVNANPDLVDAAQASLSCEDIIDFAMKHRRLCNEQVRMPWTYFGPEAGIIHGAVIPACEPCGRSQIRITGADMATESASA